MPIVSSGHPPERRWFKKPEIILGALALFVAIISIPGWWRSKSDVVLTSISDRKQQVIATTTPNLVDIITKSKSYQTSYEVGNFFKDYIGKPIYGVGTFKDFYASGDSIFLLLNVSGAGMACVIRSANEDIKKDLLLFKTGEEVFFAGIFQNASLNASSYRIIEDCYYWK